MQLPKFRDVANRIATLGRSVARAADVAQASVRNPDAIVKVSEYRAQFGVQQNAAIGSKPPVTEYVDIPVSTISDWTLASLKSTVNAHASGMFSSSALLFESMQADDRIQSAINGRVKAVTRCNVSMTPAKAGSARQAARVAKEIEALWPDLFPEQLLEQLLVWTIGEGFSISEIIWEAKDDLWVPRLKVWHPAFIYYDNAQRCFVVQTQEGPVWVRQNDPKWFVYAPNGQYRGWLRGAVRSCSIPWIIRQYALRDWARYSEVHGLPQKKIKYPAQSSPPERSAFMNAVKSLGTETSFALPQYDGKDAGQWDVELLEAKDRSWEAFRGLINQCDASITLAIRGTSLTTEVRTGSFAAAKIHKAEDSDYAEADAKKFAQAARQQLLKLYCAYNYGDANLAPTPVISAEEEADLSADADTLNTVADAVQKFETQQWPIDRQAVSDKFGILLQKGADLGKPPEAQKQQPSADGKLPTDNGDSGLKGGSQ